MLPWAGTMTGRIDRLWCESALLADNPLGDPATRPVWVKVPPGYDADAERRFPVLYWLAGFMGQVNRWEFRPPYGRPFPETADELMASGEVEVLRLEIVPDDHFTIDRRFPDALRWLSGRLSASG